MAGATLEIRPVIISALMAAMVATSVMTAIMVIITLIAHAAMMVVMLAATHLVTRMLIILWLKSLWLWPESSLVYLCGRLWLTGIEICAKRKLVLLRMERSTSHLMALTHHGDRWLWLRWSTLRIGLLEHGEWCRLVRLWHHAALIGLVRVELGHGLLSRCLHWLELWLLIILEWF